MKKLTKLSLCILFTATCSNIYLHKSIFNLDVIGIHAWRQSSTMWNIKNFARHDSNILNPRQSKWNTNSGDNIVRLEFPIMQWMIGMIYKLFGEKFFIMRSIMFGIGIFSIIAFFQIIHFETKNVLAAGLTASFVQYSPLFYYYIINPLPDLFALSMSLWYIYFIRRNRKDEKMAFLLLASLFLSLSTMAKLPYLMVSIISLFYFFKDIMKKSNRKNAIKTAMTLVTFLIIPICWYLWVIPGWSRSGVLTGVFEKGLFTSENWIIFKVHFESIFPHRLISWPVYPILFAGIIYLIYHFKKTSWLWLLLFITSCYFILELSSINVYHDYYLLPFISVIYIMIGFGIKYLLDIAQHNWLIISSLIIASSIYCIHEINEDWSIERSFTNPDFFNYSKSLKNAAPRDSKCIIMRDLSGSIFSNQIDKQGHIFDSDTFPLGWVEDMILNKEVEYMYSDSKEMNERIETTNYVDSLVLVKGSIKVYKLNSPEQMVAFAE